MTSSQPKTSIQTPFSSEDWENEIEAPDLSNLVTEDDTPVDNLISEKQQRLLITSLYSTFSPGVPFIATANVGLFYALKRPPLVPDILLSLEVEVPQNWSQKQHRSYFIWEFGKPPEVAIEIVSNKVGNELGSKLKDYAHAGVAYYVVFDPLLELGNILLRVHELRGNHYIELDIFWLEQVGLGLTLWTGIFEGKEYSWLRWCNREGQILLTGDERAEQEWQRAEQERQRAERLAELLRARGIEPDEEF